MPDDVRIYGLDANPLNEWLAPWLHTVRVTHVAVAKDKVVIVTGGPGGIDGATCRRFADEDAEVAAGTCSGCSMPARRAGRIVNIASDAAFITGEVLSVSGGLTMAG